MFDVGRIVCSAAFDKRCMIYGSPGFSGLVIETCKMVSADNKALLCGGFGFFLCVCVLIWEFGKET